MPEQKTETSEIFMDTLLSKLEQLDENVQAQGGKIELIEKRIKDAPETSADTRELRNLLQGLRNSLASLEFPEKAMRELTTRLEAAADKIGEPIKHHHHVTKIAWATLSLFLLVIITTIGWGVAAATLKGYIANDVKYRKLELGQDAGNLQYLWSLDSIYSANPDSLQKYVVDQERLKRQRLELLANLHALDKQIDTSTRQLSPPQGK